MIGQVSLPPDALTKVQPGTAAAKGARLNLTAKRGHCRPFGATPRPGGVNFALFSRHATSVHLLLFREGLDEPVAEVSLDPALNKTGDVWHVFVEGVTPDLLYAYRVNGPQSPRSGHRYS